MMSQSNYEGWDFLNTWKITEGKTYFVESLFNVFAPSSTSFSPPSFISMSP